MAGRGWMPSGARCGRIQRGSVQSISPGSRPSSSASASRGRGVDSEGRAVGQALGPQRLALLGRPAADDPGGRARAERRMAGLVVQQLRIGPGEQRLAHEARAAANADAATGLPSAKSVTRVRASTVSSGAGRGIAHSIRALTRAPGSSSSSTRAQTSRWWISSCTTRPAIARIAAGASRAARSAARWAARDDSVALVLSQSAPADRDASQEERGVLRPVQRVVRLHAAGIEQMACLRNAAQRRAETLVLTHEIPTVFRGGPWTPRHGCRCGETSTSPLRDRAHMRSAACGAYFVRSRCSSSATSVAAGSMASRRSSSCTARSGCPVCA